MEKRPNVRSTLVFLTYDEIAGVRALFDRIPVALVGEVITVDGGSTDGTAEFLRSRGVPVFSQEKKGRGEAFRIAVDRAAGEHIVFFSPDGNEDPADIPRLLSVLQNGADMAIASRFLPGSRNEEDEAAWPWRKWANQAFTWAANKTWKGSLSDSINGYRAITKEAFARLHPDADGYLIEYQLSIRAMKLGLRVGEIPTIEGDRIGGKSKSSSLPTGAAFLGLFWKELRRGREPEATR
jgi:glycosyltransferase involved in cell wall biosynthesis